MITLLTLLFGCPTPSDTGNPDTPVTWAWTQLDDMEEVSWGMPLTQVSDDSFHGFGGSGYPSGPSASDTSRMWTPSGWNSTDASGAWPAARYCHCTTYLPDHNQVLLVGGRDGAGPVTDAWTFDLGTQEWSAISGSGPHNEGVGCHATTLAGTAYVYGGAGMSGNSDTTWRYDPDARTFTDMAIDGPSPRRDAAWVSTDDAMLIWGGQTSQTRFKNDTWRFDGVAWEELADDSPPEPRRYPATAMDPESGLWLIYGGTDSAGEFDDIWLLAPDTMTWTELDAAEGPGKRAFSSATHTSEGFTVFGGLQNSTGTGLKDTWRLSAD